MEEKDIHNDVWLEEWDPEWPHQFHMEKQCIIGSLLASDHSAHVWHVGSTALEGMPAKPIAARPQMLNAGADTNDFAPVTLEEMIENNRRFREAHACMIEDNDS